MPGNYFPSTAVTRFGPAVDVRNRGALRLRRLTGLVPNCSEQPAVVLIWHNDACRELSVHDARAMAAQLNAAAAHAEIQNNIDQSTDLPQQTYP